ncbi:MAG: 2Fe-2S iron-sulfur cluster binding domain-containing protein [Spirochaetaceae bacterium]|jgi:carbon-monoxide dehydrogenase small subunit|nr:2Fe-2S iron-sulfur cluster binding domain-containing protein [Spirochaetaceae bacterium]
MNIRFSLNGVSASIDAKPGERLSAILRDRFHLKGTKCGCLQGRCGTCSVIWNGAVTASCLIPAFRLSGTKVVTIEGFVKTNNYQDIKTGFAQVPVILCGYCDSAKILVAESLLVKNSELDREEILSAFNGIRCTCTNPDTLVDGVFAAAKERKVRLDNNANKR